MAITVPEVVSFVLSAAFCGWYCLKKHWLANNTLGLAFSIQGVEYISVGKLATGVSLPSCTQARISELIPDVMVRGPASASRRVPGSWPHVAHWFAEDGALSSK